MAIVCYGEQSTCYSPVNTVSLMCVLALPHSNADSKAATAVLSDEDTFTTEWRSQLDFLQGVCGLHVVVQC